MPQKKSPATDDAAWARAFRDVMAPGRGPVGEGWILSSDLKKKLGFGHMKFHLAIRAMRDAGTVEFFSGHRHLDGKWRRAVWYRLIQNRPAKKG
jgi:hypothetical protein